MLDTLRTSATNIFAKILLGLLVLMFGVWGIGDILRGPSKFTIATVGSETISSDDYLRALHREAENIRQIMGGNFSLEILKNPAISNHVLQQLVNHLLIKQESEALGLIPSDADVARRIRTNSLFLDEKGNFDKKLFDGMLQASHTSEKHYVEQLREDIGANLLIDTLTNAVPVTDIAAHILLAEREEGRSVSLYSLEPSAITNLPVPDAAQIKSYYDAHNHDFTAPEYRTVSYVTISASNVSKTAISEDELRAAYKERLDEFKHPERRVVEQLLYSSKDAADKASAMLKAGESFEQVGKETNIMNKGALSLGKVERTNVIEVASDKVFSLQNGQVTEPIQSPFGWHIFRVTAIEPPSVSSFEEARPAIEKDIILHSADDALNKLANKFQDALAGGNTLAEAAQDNGLKVVTVGSFDHLGNAPDSTKPAAGLPDLNKFIEVAFKTEENGESPMTVSKGGIYYLLHVDKITPEKLRPLNEVAEHVKSAQQEEEKKDKLRTLAVEISKKFVNPSERNAVIEKYKLALVKKVTIKRDTQSAGDTALPAALVHDIFASAVQGGTSAYQTKNGDYLMATLDAVVPAALPGNDPKMAATLADVKKGLETLEKNEIVQQYTEYLSKKYPVSINQSALQAVQ